ncbi:hypothetical protein [Nocardia sp. BMG111209]|uniref:hypothetical protein n=1 Tax=Nocardia sp. BMG111209 TaxID=1160137 RepID=UPI00037B9623|nr:hypothetical protein [Nocardia sp. BMG111209]
MISVLVAAVSVFGTALGAALTAIVAARSETRRQGALERQQKRQELEQREGHLRELRLEHLRWRRERRQTAYLDLLGALSAADRANQQYFRELCTATAPMPLDTDRLAEIRRLSKDGEQLLFKVVLEGPAEVAEVAQNLITRLGSLVAEVRQFAEDHANSVADTAEHAIAVDVVGQSFIAIQREFLKTARDALDEIINEA